MSDIIKIVILLPTLNVGGAERLVLEEMRYLKQSKCFKLEVHTIFEAGALKEKFESLGITVYAWEAPHRSIKMIITYLKIVNYLRRQNVKVLHTHLASYIGPWVGYLAGVKKNIITVHTDIVFNFFRRLGIKRCDLVFACGEKVRDNVVNFVAPEYVRILNNATSIPNKTFEYKKIIEHKYNIKPGNRILLSFGRLIEAKGYDVLIESFYEVVQSLPDVVLIIGGDGPEKNLLQGKINEYGLQDKVYLIGLVDDVNSLYQYASVYVNSSRWEGLPMTLLEAMAHEKAIVATNVGGNSELVINGKTGVLVDNVNSLEIADAIYSLLDDKNKCKALSKGASDLFMKKYSIEEHCKILAQEYAINNLS